MKNTTSVDTPVDPKALQADLEVLLNLAKSAGADHADAVATHGRSLSISVRGGDVEDVDSSEGRDIGLRVIIGDKQACVSTSDRSLGSLKMLSERAAAMAKLAPSDPYCGLADAQFQDTSPKDLDLFDPTVCTAQALTERAREIEDAALSYPGVMQADNASAGATSSAIFFMTSHGFAQGWRSSRHNMSVAVIADKDGQMERDYDYAGGRWLADVKPAKDIGSLAAKRAVSRLGARKVTSAKMPIMFDRRIAGSMIATLKSAISGPSVTRGVSFLLDKLGEPIFNPHVTIIDDPLILRGHGSRPWDGEGVKVKARKVIDKGVLTTWLLNTASAKQLDMETTGHAYRSVGAPPGVATTNFYMQNGAQSPEQMMQDMKDGILVTDMFGPSLNNNTGDYSVGVSGFKIENGQIAYPVNEITVAANILDVYKNIIPANDLKMDAATTAPSLLLGEMAVAGE